MLKRSLLTLLALPFPPLAALLTLLPLVLVRRQLNEPTLILAWCLNASLAVAVLLIVANLLLRRIWFFRGSGEPVSVEVLRARLLAVNGMACPVEARARRRTLVFAWRIGETRWCELFSHLGISRLYELHCRLDSDTRTVFLADRVRLADLVICPDRVRIGRPRIPLPLLRARSSDLTGVDGYAGLEPHDWQFHGREIKGPVLGTILKSGWHARFTLF